MTHSIHCTCAYCQMRRDMGKIRHFKIGGDSMRIPLRTNTGHRILNNIMGDKWSNNGRRSREDTGETENWWSKSDESFDYPKTLPTSRCTGCGKLLPEIRMSPTISPHPPYTERLKDKPICEDCMVQSTGWKMQHGIAPPYPEKRLSEDEQKQLFVKGGRKWKPQAFNIEKSPTSPPTFTIMTPEEKAAEKKEFAKRYWGKL